jgi:FixH
METKETKAIKGIKNLPGFVFGLAFMAVAVVGANLYLVFRSSSMHQDMVRDDYYAESLKHDTLVLAQRRADSLIHHLPMSMQLELQGNAATVTWTILTLDSNSDSHSAAGNGAPLQAFMQSLTHCEAIFYRPGDRSLDQAITLSQDTGLQSQDAAVQWQGVVQPLKPGLWRVSVRWYDGPALILAREFHHGG